MTFGEHLCNEAWYNWVERTKNSTRCMTVLVGERCGYASYLMKLQWDVISDIVVDYGSRE